MNLRMKSRKSAKPTPEGCPERGYEDLMQFYNAATEGLGLAESGKMVDVNDRIVEMFGYERSELIGRPVMDLVAPHSRGLVMERMKSGYDQPYEHDAIRKDGSIFPVRVSGKTFKYQGRPRRATSIMDISRRREAEKARERTEGQYREMFEGAPVGIIRSQPDGSILTVTSHAS